MTVIFAYLAGLLTLINPCVLPVLPLVLTSALQNSKWGPTALAAGMSVTFIALGLFVASFGPALGIDDQIISQTAAVLMVGFGLILLIPRLSARFAGATGGFASNADAQIDGLDRGLRGQFVGGMLLGAVWTPCVGPTLGAALSYAATGDTVWQAFATMVFFALGVSTIIFALGYGARSALQRRQALMRRIADKSRPILGIVFILVGMAILFRVHHAIELWALDALPHWFLELSVRF
ncbi:MAG: cytochrome c biogenesis CcdA family protein [Pseudomonadota bacterium]